MPDCFLSRIARPGVRAVVVAMAMAFTSAAALAADHASTTPRFVQQALPAATLLGQGQLRFLGLRIYDARLWAGPQFKAADFDAHPLGLELSYHRAFKGDAIAQRSIEEIERQGELAPALAQRWQQALADLLPDVQAGDRLTGLYQPGRGMQFWRGDQPLGRTDDAELARRFFAIWLSPRTSEPGLRAALLARQSQSRP